MKSLKSTRIYQVIIIVLLSITFILSFLTVSRLQGTARVINYAGIARGATQRLVKLEIAGRPNEELEAKLDVILFELKNGGEQNQLVRLNDDYYQQCLDAQIEGWTILKEQIAYVRENGYETSDIIEVSEAYFVLADTTVFAAEKYSATLEDFISVCEVAVAIELVFLIAINLWSFTLYRRMRGERELSIRYQAQHDGMTDLFNRRAFDEILKEYEKKTENIALLIIDVDYFKGFNDSFGHATGDKVLIRVADTLRATFRENDILFRIGGDEFAVIMVGVNSSFRNIVETRIQSVQKNLAVSKEDIPTITLSIGVAFSDLLKEEKDIFNSADSALYEVKERGRNGYLFFG